MWKRITEHDQPKNVEEKILGRASSLTTLSLEIFFYNFSGH